MRDGEPFISEAMINRCTVNGKERTTMATEDEIKRMMQRYGWSREEVETRLSLVAQAEARLKGDDYAAGVTVSDLADMPDEVAQRFLDNWVAGELVKELALHLRATLLTLRKIEATWEAVKEILGEDL